MLLAGIGAVVLAGGVSYISTRSTDTKPLKPDDPTEVVISADAMVGKNMAQKEWRAQSENQIKDAVDRVKAIESKMPGLEKGGTDIAALQQENEKLKADGARLFKIYEEQNTAQAAKLKALEEGGVAAPGSRASGASIARWKQPAAEPFRVAGADGDAAAAGRGGAGQFAGDAGSMPAIAEVKTISFAPATPKGGAGKSDDGQGFIGARPDAPASRRRPTPCPLFCGLLVLRAQSSTMAGS